MCDVEKIEFEKAVNNSFSALKKSADSDGERTAAVTMSDRIKQPS